MCKTSDTCASMLQCGSESKHRYERRVHLLQNKGEKQGSEVVSLQQTVAFLPPAAVDDRQNLGVVGNHTHPVLQHSSVKLSNFPAYRASGKSHAIYCSVNASFNVISWTVVSSQLTEILTKAMQFIVQSMLHSMLFPEQWFLPSLQRSWQKPCNLLFSQCLIQCYF